MSRIQEEMRVIPRAAWVIAFALYAGFVILAWTAMIPGDPKLALWPVWGRALFAFGIPLFLLVLVLLIGYVNGDARRRGMRAVLWTLLAIFIPNAIGIILYFILRDPPMRTCPQCGGNARAGFAFCPSCGATLSPTCSACRHAVEAGWSHCPNCGEALRAA
jgi:Double zinc ribbon